MEPQRNSFSKRHSETGESSIMGRDRFLRSMSNKIDHMVESIKKIHEENE